MTSPLLDPAAIDRAETLGLFAAGVVDGYMAGDHRSPLRGFSIEFTEHREYVPGDDPRRLDWKVLGRTDRLMLKQYEQETNVVCHVLLDGSASMAYRSADGPPAKGPPAGQALQVRLRPDARRLPRLPRPAAAGRRLGHRLRHRRPRPRPPHRQPRQPRHDPRHPCRRQARPADRHRGRPPSLRRPPPQAGHRPDRHRRVRRRAADPGRPGPPPLRRPRGRPLPHARPVRDRVPVRRQRRVRRPGAVGVARGDAAADPSAGGPPELPRPDECLPRPPPPRLPTQRHPPGRGKHVRPARRRPR